MIKFITKLIIFASLLFLVGCVTDTPAQITGTPRTHRGISTTNYEEPFVYEEPQPVAYPVLYRGPGGNRAMLEPAEGAYLGGWLAPETAIRVFEFQADKRHAVFVNEINLGEDVPISWLLHNIASLTTPLFVVHPPRTDDFDDVPVTDLIIYLAQRLGSFNLPMFVAFYPTHDLPAAEYTLLFRMARNIFHTHAPMVSFVWMAPSHSATELNPFFPGHSAVDWVGISLFACWDAENYFTDILKMFEEFYMNFHHHAPVMILPLGVSHFTRGDYRYRLKQAAEEISRLYNALQSFPRLGLIVYADAFSVFRAGNDDFSVSIEPPLMNAYAAAIAGEFFLSSVEKNAANENRWIRSFYSGYVWEDRIYISTRTAENELNLPAPRQTIEINERFFADARRIPEKIIRICYERQVIFIENMP
ncbi:MAG: hypothetical protein FWF79_04465 [Defluviitaleaceae bacterium]|nr:hypothetical protein [Defluviitaleaceae bacterium]